MIWVSINFYIMRWCEGTVPIFAYICIICTIISFLGSFLAALLPWTCHVFDGMTIGSIPQLQGHHEAAVWLLKHVPESNIADGRNMRPEVNPAGFCWDNEIFRSKHFAYNYQNITHITVYDLYTLFIHVLLQVCLGRLWRSPAVSVYIT